MCKLQDVWNSRSTIERGFTNRPSLKIYQWKIERIINRLRLWSDERSFETIFIIDVQRIINKHGSMLRLSVTFDRNLNETYRSKSSRIVDFNENRRINEK